MAARRCTRLVTAALSTLLLAGTFGVAGAQTPAPPPAAGPWFEADLRVGGLWPQEAPETLPTVGGRIAIYPWSGAVGSRLSLQGLVDYRQLGREEDFDVSLGTPTVLTEHLFVAAPALGIDLIRTPRVAFEMRAGGALVGHRTTFGLETDDRHRDDFGDFENVCRFTAFRDRCDSDYGFTGTVAAGVRGFLRPDGGIFIGVDYTYLTRGQNVLVGTVGYRFH